MGGQFDLRRWPGCWCGGFEISRKCAHVCASLLCLCALEVPLKQKRGVGGGWGVDLSLQRGGCDAAGVGGD